MLTYKKILGCVAVILVLAVVSPVSATNVMLNPGFESGTGGDADNWAERYEPYASRSNADAHTGDWSMKCIDDGTHTDAYVWQAELGHQLNWTAGTTITTSVYAKGLMDDPERVLVRLYLYDENLAYLGYQSYWRTNANVSPTAWAEVTADYVVPANTTIGSVTLQLHYVLINQDGNGYVYFDDASVVPEPATMLLLGLGCLGLVSRKRR